MAKMFAKKKKIKVPTCETYTGKSNDETFTLSFDEAVKRFSLKKNDELIVSGFFHDCLFRAKEYDVEWDEEPELKFETKEV